MRSLWRVMAVRWLGGEASDALTGDAGLLDLLMQQDRYVPPAVLVQRQSGVSHRAMMLQQEQSRSEDESVLDQFLGRDRDA
jgi:hypothetical protein